MNRYASSRTFIILFIAILWPSASFAIIVSDPSVIDGDGEPTASLSTSHVIPSGGTFNGLNLDGVALLTLLQNNNAVSFIGSGVRLAGSNFVLTAGHVADDALGVGAGFYDGIESAFLFDGVGDTDFVTAQATNGFGGPQDIFIHPKADRLISGAVDFNAGFDVALLRMNSIPDDIPGYSLYSGDPFGRRCFRLSCG